jgi:protein CpxP
MKKLLMICALFFAVITYANAQQGPGSPEERAKKNVERLTAKLKLTDVQKAKAEVLYADLAKEQAKVKDESGEDKVAFREKSMKLKKEIDEKFVALLTADQKTEYQKMQDEQKERMKNRGDKKPQDGNKPAPEM